MNELGELIADIIKGLLLALGLYLAIGFILLLFFSK